MSSSAAQPASIAEPAESVAVESVATDKSASAALGLVEPVAVEPVAVDDDNHFSTVSLSSGRRIAYIEKGCSAKDAQRTLLVLHGIGSSRIASMPGVSDDLLWSFSVRLVSIDRPGYGRSDPCPSMTMESFCQDVEEVAEMLEMGDKFWLLGYSAGGAFCWAAARFIPHRIRGIAMWAPMGSFYWKGMTPADRDFLFAGMTSNANRSLRLGRLAPPWALRLFIRTFTLRTAGHVWLKRVMRQVAVPDRLYLDQEFAARGLINDNFESLLRGGRGEGMAKDVELFCRPWSFDLQDLLPPAPPSATSPSDPSTTTITALSSSATPTPATTSPDTPIPATTPSPPSPATPSPLPFRIHIWHGTADSILPIAMQRWPSKQLPGLVQLYELEGEGHFSWFCHQPANHAKVLETLFGEGSV